VVKAGGRPYVIDRQPPADGIPWVECDLADTRAAEAATREVIAQAGGLTGVVTAAGMDVPGALADIPGETWDRIVTIDLLATAAVIRAAIPALTESHGTAVTIASTLGVKAVSDATAYCAAKFGVVGFTRALAAELAGAVGVTLIIPGGMRTRFFDDRDERYKPGADAILNDPANVANAIMFALSQPPGCAVRELVVAAETETSYP
jgi:NAD(P)-dependent dehydrogenase (short-subunit alcohol dehydrogenase family)